MKAIGSKVNSISEITNSVASAVGQQTVDTTEIAGTLSRSNYHVRSLSTDKDELTGSAQGNLQSASELLEIVVTLKSELEDLGKNLAHS